MGKIVISLFDGMGCAALAFKDAGIEVDKYYCSEIDKKAIETTKITFLEHIHLGSVSNVRYEKGILYSDNGNFEVPHVDFLVGGSPCQGFSFAGKGLNFEDPRSKLFFEYVRILNEVKAENPNVYFLLENVQMKIQHNQVITSYMGIEPICINSALVSAQNRVRLYWSNIGAEVDGLFGDLVCKIPQPKDEGILLKHILQDDVDEKYYLSEGATIRHAIGDRSRMNEVTDEKTGSLLANQAKQSSDMICVAMRGRNPENPSDRTAGIETEQRLEPRGDGKTNCLTSVQKDNLVIQINPSKESGGKQPYQQNRIYDPEGKNPALTAGLSTGSNAIIQSSYRQDTPTSIDKDKHPCLRAEAGGKTKGIGIIVPEATTKGFIEVQPGECFDAENPNSTTRRGRKMTDKSNCLMAKETDFMQYTKDFRIRRLTPIECCRLQTVPDSYFYKDGKQIVSDSAIYKMLGNGWTIKVISHILKFSK